MRRRWYQPGVIVLLMITLMCTVACNDKGKVRERASNEQTEITEDFVPITDIEEGRPDIYVIVKSMTSSYWEVVLDGAKQAGIDKECNIYAAGSRLETEWKLQEAYVKLAVERGADGIILGPDNSVKLSSVVETENKKGIPIIIVDTLVNTQNYDVCYMTDNLLAGENAAKEMIRILKEKGHKDEDKLEVAIELGAKRVGHGIAMAGHDDLVQLCADRRIGVEMCPTSNLQTKAIREFADYPIMEFYHAGVPVSVNTDNRTVSGTTCTDEYVRLTDAGMMNERMSERIYRDSVEMSFASDDIKHKLLQSYDELFMI